MKQRFGLVLSGLLILGVTSSTSAQTMNCDDTGQPVKRVTRLGNPGTSMHRPPLRTMDDFKKILDNKAYVARAGSVLNQACLGANATAILDAARTGEVREVSVAPGTPLRWMGSRRGAGVKVIRPIVWAGKAPFEGFEWKTTIGDSVYTFVVPKACGNLSLADVTPLPSVSTSARIECRRDGSGNPQTTVTVSSVDNLKGASVDCNGSPVALSAANNWTATFPGEVREGACKISGQDAWGRAANITPSYSPCPALPPPPPPPPPAPTCSVTIDQTAAKKCWAMNITSNKAGALSLTKDGAAVPAAAFAKGSSAPAKVDAGAPATVTVCQPGTYTAKVQMDGANASCEASTTLTKGGGVPVAALLPFVGAFFGKERRVLDAFPGGRCAPMGGPEVGLSFRPNGGTFELAPAVGFAINTRNGASDHSALFADVELNKHFGSNKGFVGTGLSLWDITHSKDFTPGALAQFGVRLNDTSAKTPFYWVNQGRLFFDQKGQGVSNNYQFWSGFRLLFGQGN